MKRNPDPSRTADPRILTRAVRFIKSTSENEPVKPAVRHTHPKTGQIALFGSFSRGVPAFIQKVHDALAERLIADGFRLLLSAGENFRDWEHAEGILITDPAWLTPEREKRLRSGQRGFVLLTTRQAGPNTVFLDASGAWLNFLLAAEQRKTNRVLILGTKTEEGMPALSPPVPLMKAFSRRKPPVFQTLPKETVQQNDLPPDLAADDICLLTDDIDAALRFSGRRSSQSAAPGFWTACMLPGCDVPEIRDRSFRIDPGIAAREMQHVLYRQMTTGNTEDPGAILPILWGEK